MVFSYLKNKYAVSELFREVSPKIADRPGGYTRILKTGARLGDNADMCIIELVDYNENMLAAQAEAKTLKRIRIIFLILFLQINILFTLKIN
jgi:large subunit ribosomal protein L17